MTFDRLLDQIQTMAKETAPVILDCGLVPYGEALDWQSRLLEMRIADETPNTVLLLEHPPVITRGARKPENKILRDAEFLAGLGIDVVDVKRGGGATAHNPGQLVIYPVVKLSSVKMRVVPYIRFLESAGIELLESLGVAAVSRKGFPGLWTACSGGMGEHAGFKKIASIGVQLLRGTAMHGMAVNLSNDLSIFDWIVPCGLQGVRMTSAALETAAIDMQAAKKTMADICRRHLNPGGTA